MCIRDSFKRDDEILKNLRNIRFEIQNLKLPSLPNRLEENAIKYSLSTVHKGKQKALFLTGCHKQKRWTSSAIVNRKTLTIKKPLVLSTCLLYTSPSPRDQRGSRMPSSA
eukprot:TRINITY_DN19193_c0_g1_i1.p2 TRINITY_DN19193_c0_g1~~TRINITY_DN19193_c0_g1_i1.p2  ORF type:complete len:110 (-),score=37.88 TRINITY_DN19193_c0_g1_i1:12-341(-)